MKHLISFVVLMCCFSFGFSQQIIMKKSLGGIFFYQGEKRLRLKEVSQQLEVNPKAAGIFTSARKSETLATVLYSIGGALIGYPLGVALAGQEADWELAGVGAGLLVVSFPIYSSAARKATTAIAFYNEAYPYVFSEQPDWELSAVADHRGIGLSVAF